MHCSYISNLHKHPKAEMQNSPLRSKS